MDEWCHRCCRASLTYVLPETAEYFYNKYGKKTLVKVHCSSGQEAKHFIDPETGKPINFNFLPTFSTSKMGIMAHTVQLYSYDDPAPTYGNQNFSYMLDYMFREAGKREVAHYGETAYWSMPEC